MRATFDLGFWNRLNILSKILMIIGLWFVEASMWVQGYDQNVEVKENSK